MADVLVLERMMRYHERRSLWRAKRFNPRIDLLAGLSDSEIVERYRMNAQTIDYVCELLSPSLTHPTRNSGALPCRLQLLVALRFYGSGAFLTLIADCTRVSRAAACRSVRVVSEALCDRLRQFVKWPTGAEAELVEEKFYSLAGEIIIL